MMRSLPRTGTQHLLDLLAPYAPDDFIDGHWPNGFTGGRRCALSAAQLWRVHLLALLTPTHSLNLLVAQLPEQAAWRRFARLRRHLPGARMLHEFRERVGVSGLRQINQQLLTRLLRRQGGQPHAVALMDATDLPAACVGFKKKTPALTPPATPPWADARSRPDRAAGMSATRSTRCDCGCPQLTPPSPCCRWS